MKLHQSHPVVPLSEETVTRSDFDRGLCPLPPSSPERIASIDIARVLGAIFIMWWHFLMPTLVDVHSSGRTFRRFLSFFMGGDGVVAMFFVFSGYFICRAVTWKKALTSAAWCMIAYLIWNTIYLLQTDWGRISFTFDYFIKAYGFTQIASLCSGGSLYHWSAPSNSSLWFLRDLPFLYLLAPLVYRHIKFIFPVLLVAALMPPLAIYFARMPGWVLSPYTILFFCLGCYFRSTPKDFQIKVLRFYSPQAVLWLLIFAVICTEWGGQLVKLYHLKRIGFMPAVTSAVQMIVLYWMARWLEERVPRAKRLGLILAPAAFLAYVAHYPIIHLLKPILTTLDNYDPILIIMPFPVMGILYTIFLCMKRWCSPLLRPLAYYKPRPNDTKCSKLR